jgi:para-aminobenzoate synthetase component 1
MRQFGPVGVESLPFQRSEPPGVPPLCRGRVRERSRLEWRAADGGDPAHLVEAFLAGDGLPVRDLAAPAPAVDHAAGGPCGAALFVSAAGGAAMIGAPAGAASPAPDVPDVTVVRYDHGLPAVPPAGRGTPPDLAPYQLGAWVPSWTDDAHAAAVEAVRAAIARGDVYQVNVVGHASAPYTGDPLPALARLGRLPGARYGGVLTGAGWALGCASPETLVEVAGDRVVTRPIKGTRPATARGRTELLGSAKERAEHVMIVDLERNDLARVARTGTVRVDSLFALRRWSGLWQAESEVSARLVPGCGLADLLRAVCPGGSVTGAPKRAALARIAAGEPVGRGPSMGALGWVGADGDLDLGLTIRTAAAVASGPAGGRMHVWAGGGIVWDSDPRAEVAEAAAKAAPVKAALAS